MTDGASAGSVVCAVEGGMLMFESDFPYFMMAAPEAGRILLGHLLLLLYPRVLGHELATKAIVMMNFVGFRKDELARMGMVV
jgi:hypothetical protein